MFKLSEILSYEDRISNPEIMILDKESRTLTPDSRFKLGPVVIELDYRPDDLKDFQWSSVPCLLKALSEGWGRRILLLSKTELPKGLRKSPNLANCLCSGVRIAIDYKFEYL